MTEAECRQALAGAHSALRAMMGSASTGTADVSALERARELQALSERVRALSEQYRHLAEARRRRCRAVAEQNDERVAAG